MAITSFNQWSVTALEILTVLGGSLTSPSSILYLLVRTNDPDQFWIVEKTDVPQPGGYTRVDVRADSVTIQQVRNFLVSQGETLPALADLGMRVRTSPTPPVLGGFPLFDELVVFDKSQRITRL